MTYHIARDGQQQGTFSEHEVQNGLNSGRFLPSDLCWAEGMAEWKPIGAVFTQPVPVAVAAAAPAPLFTPTANPYAPPSSDIRTNFNARLPLAGLGQRFGAAMLDGLIALVIAVPALIAIPMMESAENGDVEAIPPLAMGLVGITGVLFLILMVYTIYLLSVKGQTLGKKMIGIRIVNHLDDSNAGFVRAFLLRGIVNAIPGAIIPFYGIIDVCVIFGAERRCIHDYIAGTRVIQG